MHSWCVCVGSRADPLLHDVMLCNITYTNTDGVCLVGCGVLLGTLIQCIRWLCITYKKQTLMYIKQC